MTWIYKGKELQDEDIPQGSIGFVYEITNSVTGRKYLGRKILFSTTRKPPKAGKTRRTKVVSESTWRKYYGSSLEMKQDLLTYGEKSFIREILIFCKSKSVLSYYETKYIFERDALIKELYINRWCTCQINSKNLKEIFIN